MAPVMSWSLGALWLIAIGSVALTLGTGAQAWVSFAEYRDLYGAQFKNPRIVVKGWRQMVAPNPSPSGIKALLRSLSVPWCVFILFWVPPRTKATAEAPTEPTEQDVLRASRLIHDTSVWWLLMGGSALVLAAATIQLVVQLS
jgi:hypothetical protein